MINRHETTRPSPLPADLRRLARAATATFAGLALVTATLTLAGCGEEEEAPVVQAPPPPPPPPPPKPTVTPVAQLMKELGISPKIRMAEDKAPPTDVERVAVLKFFDAFAKSTPNAIKPIVGEEDRLVLELMEKNDAFTQATQAIERVDLTTGVVEGKSYVMAVYRTDGAFQPQLWQYKAEGEGRTISKQNFDSYIQPVDVMSKISGANLIAEWIKLVAAERKLADQPDETFRAPARVQAEEKSEDAPASGGAPQGPIGAPPMRNRPTGPPLKPPGPSGPGQGELPAP